MPNSKLNEAEPYHAHSAIHIMIAFPHLSHVEAHLQPGSSKAEKNPN